MFTNFFKTNSSQTTTTQTPHQSPSIASDTTGVIITSEGGAGHISAAYKEQQECLKKGIKCVIIYVNKEGWYTFQYTERYGASYIPFVASWLNHNFAEGPIKAWNEAQKKSDLATQKSIIRWQKWAGKLFGPNFIEKINTLLQKNPQINLVISTQPMGIANIFSAVADINHMKVKGEKPIQFKVVMTDIPSSYAIHFLDSFKEINDKNLEHAELILDIPYPPLKASHSSNRDYHEEFAKLCPTLYMQDGFMPKSNIKINFNMGPIDQKFQELFDLLNSKDIPFAITELKKQPIPIQLTLTACEKYITKLPHLIVHKKEEEINLITAEMKIPENANIMTLMLGSQAAIQGTLDILETEYLLHKELNITKPTYLFVFCGDDKPNESNLFDKVCDKAKAYHLENKFIIVPLTNQNKTTISRLYFLKETSVIRPGGLSVMEQAIASTLLPEKKIIIYAEIPADMPEAKSDPRLGLFQWERGNAESLEINFGRNNVSIENSLTYAARRKKLLKGESTAHARQIKEPEIEKYIDTNLTDFCHLLTLNSKKAVHDINALIIGCAIYRYQNKSVELSVNMLIYGYAYDQACCYIESYSTTIPHYKFPHPSNWAIRFANFILNFYNETKQSLHNQELIDAIEKTYAFAKDFVSAFYENIIEILSDDEALLYADKKKKYTSEAAVKAVELAREAEKNELVLINSSTLPTSYDNLWDKGATFSEKISAIFNDYTAFSFGFHIKRTHSDLANQIKDKAASNTTLQELLEFILASKNKPGVKPSGSFGRRATFVIKKIEEEIERQNILGQDELNEKRVLSKT